MTPKEKAAILIRKYAVWSAVDNEGKYLYSAKQCSLIAVNEMIEIRNEIINTLKLGALDIEVISFLEEVKKEIENL